MPSVLVKLLGGFDARLSAGPHLDIASKKTRALLAFLALPTGRPHSRAKLVGLLWSERSDEQARNSLRQALAELTRALSSVEPSPLVKGRDTLALDAAAVEADTTLFEQLSTSEETSDLRRAAALYGGDLLEGFSARDPAFDEWLTIERDRFRSLAASVLGKLVGRETGSSAIAVAQRLLALDPLQEESHRALMRFHADAGEIGMALRQYELCRDTLRRELGTMPSPDTEALHREIRRRAKEPVAQPDRSTTPSVETVQGRGASSEMPTSPSIAVMPFRNLSGDPTQEYFSDGIAEDLITDLSRAPGLFVITRHSSFAYKESSADVRDIARELGVRYLIEGSARQDGGRVRINAQLIDAIEGRHLWAERFDRSLDDVFAVQEEVAGRIVEALVGRVMAPPERNRPTTLAAYELCVRGRTLIGQTLYAQREGRVLLRRAVELDPGYAEAHRWLALGLWAEWRNADDSEAADLHTALTTAERAVALDPNDAGNRWVLGYLLAVERRWHESDVQLAAALTLDPNHADALAIQSDLSVMSGRPMEAIDQIERALRLNPRPVWWYWWLLGQAQYAARQYDRAAKTLRREETYRTESRRTLAAALAQLGRLDEAHEEAKLFMIGNPHFTIRHWVDTQAVRDEVALRHFIEGYRQAGLPE
jgi:TolB-like protein